VIFSIAGLAIAAALLAMLPAADNAFAGGNADYGDYNYTKNDNYRHNADSMRINDGAGYGERADRESYPPPLQQLRSNPNAMIKCNDPLSLYVRDNATPVCISESAYSLLLSFGIDISPHEYELKNVTIGLLAPASGGAASYGQDVMAAAGLAVDDFNRMLEKKNKDWRLALDAYDTETNPALVDKYLRELNSKDVKIVSGPAIDIFDDDTLQYANDNGMLLFSCCSAVAAYSISDDALYRMTSDQTEFGAAVAGVLSEHGAKVAIPVGRNAPWITDMMDSAETEFGSLGGVMNDRILYSFAGEFDDAVLQKLSDRIAMSEPNSTAVLYAGFEETFDFLEAASLHDNLGQVQWFGVDANSIIHDNDAGLEFAEQVNFVSVYPAVPDNSKKTKLAERLSAELGRDPSTYAFLEYDLIQLLGHSMLASESSNAADIAVNLNKTAAKYHGVSGKISFNNAGDRIGLGYAASVAGGGKWTDISDVAVQLESGLELSMQEAAWIKDNPVIRVAYDPSWEPIEYADESGNLSGVTAQYADAFEGKLGVGFEPVLTEDWGQALNTTRNGEADVLFMIVDTEERRKWLGFTTPHFTVSSDVATLGSEQLSSEDLNNITVAVIENYAIVDWLNENRPDVEYVGVAGFEEGLALLQDGEVDAFIDVWDVLAHHAERLGIENLHNAGPSGHSYDLSIGYLGDQVILGSIMQKTLDALLADGTLPPS